MQIRLAFCLFASLLGILLLFYLVHFLPPEQLNIAQINLEKINKEIKLNAKVLNIKDYETSSFQVLLLEDSTGRVRAVSNSRKQLVVEKNRTYSFTGKIEENSYNQTRTLQLKLDKIEKSR